jgi:hypothetical protein
MDLERHPEHRDDESKWVTLTGCADAEAHSYPGLRHPHLIAEGVELCFRVPFSTSVAAGEPWKPEAEESHLPISTAIKVAGE